MRVGAIAPVHSAVKTPTYCPGPTFQNLYSPSVFKNVLSDDYFVLFILTPLIQNISLSYRDYFHQLSVYYIPGFHPRCENTKWRSWKTLISVYSLILYAVPRYMQASEKQMEKPLPGICFGRLATGTKMGVTCMPRHSLQNTPFHLRRALLLPATNCPVWKKISCHVLHHNDHTTLRAFFSMRGEEKAVGSPLNLQHPVHPIVLFLRMDGSFYPRCFSSGSVSFWCFSQFSGCVIPRNTALYLWLVFLLENSHIQDAVAPFHFWAKLFLLWRDCSPTDWRPKKGGCIKLEQRSRDYKQRLTWEQRW